MLVLVRIFWLHIMKSWLLVSGVLWIFAGTSLLMKGFQLIEGSIWIALAVIVGLAKGHFVLSKTVHRMREKAPGVKYLLLIGLMVSMGMALRFVPNQVRGFIDIAVGHALLYGGVLYLWYWLPRSISKAR